MLINAYFPYILVFLSQGVQPKIGLLRLRVVLIKL